MFCPFQMRPLSLVVLLLCGQLLGYEVKVRVIDETGAPVVGATVSVLFVNYGGSDVRKGASGAGGDYAASGRGNNSVMIRVEKSGYYSAQLKGLSKDKDHDVQVMLPRILKPIPLYAMRELSPRFPVQDEWVGFDFENADWVAPYGKGKTIDIRFRLKSEFKGWSDGVEQKLDRLIAESKELYKIRREEWTMEGFKMMAGKWDAVMEVSFPDGEEGALEVKRLLEYSQLKMSHVAPMDGYVSTLLCAASNYRGPTTQEDVGVFLRTRTKRDKEGNVISANFTKVIGGFHLNARDRHVTFSYHFNPVPNDRNLECATERNFFKAPMHGGYIFNIEP